MQHFFVLFNNRSPAACATFRCPDVRKEGQLIVQTMVGEIISAELEVSSTDNEVTPLSMLLHGAEALIVLFCPFCFGSTDEKSMEALMLDVNSKIDFFDRRDLRVVAITRELPSTNRHWVSEKDWKIQVYSDCSLQVSTALVGTFDLSLYVLATKGVNLGTFFVGMPAVLIIGGDGKILSKYVASSPGT